jgi:hypothetical protein
MHRRFFRAQIVHATVIVAALAALSIGPAVLPASNRTASDRPVVRTHHSEPSMIAEPVGSASSQLVCAALAASAHDAASVGRWQNKFEQFARRMRSSDRMHGTPGERARAIHAFLHAEILRGKYDAATSDLASALAGGPFNCASATALWIALARECGLDARAVSVVGHVWCRLDLAGEPFDVETTSRDWFLLADRRAQDPALAVTPAYQDHLRRRAVARELDERALVAIFHYNRGVRLLREGRFLAAANANLAALALDGQCQPAYGNLAAALVGLSSERGPTGVVVSSSEAR